MAQITISSHIKERGSVDGGSLAATNGPRKVWETDPLRKKGSASLPPGWLLGLTVLNGTLRQTKVRLAEIDTPETHQPYGSRAKQALSALVFDKEVRVMVVDTDRYGRTVGRLYTDALDVNAEMVRQGAAWVYRKYSNDPPLLLLEQEARSARRGLWALPESGAHAPVGVADCSQSEPHVDNARSPVIALSACIGASGRTAAPARWR